jgi:hypothetical protein
MPPARIPAWCWSLLLVPCLVVHAGCSSSSHSRDPARGGNPLDAVQLWHVVIIRLNNPGDAEAQRKILDAAHRFRSIPGVETVLVGRVIPGTRPRQDNNFDVGMVIGFRSKEDLDAYVKNPIHVEAANNVLKPLARDWTVYDFANE